MEFRYKWKEIIIFFQISSETVITATVAAFDVPPQVLSRNVKYGTSFGSGQSCSATGLLNSLETWFMHLTFRHRDWSTLVYFRLFTLFVYIVAWSKKHCPDWSEYGLSSGPLLAS